MTIPPLVSDDESGRALDIPSVSRSRHDCENVRPDDGLSATHSARASMTHVQVTAGVVEGDGLSPRGVLTVKGVAKSP